MLQVRIVVTQGREGGAEIRVMGGTALHDDKNDKKLCIRDSNSGKYSDHLFMTL